MWLLIEYDDPTIDPGHNEKQRILIDQHDIIINQFGLMEITASLIGAVVHPCTPGDTGYHCPICHKDVPPKFPPIPKGSLPGKIKIDKKDLDKLRELNEGYQPINKKYHQPPRDTGQVEP